MMNKKAFIKYVNLVYHLDYNGPYGMFCLVDYIDAVKLFLEDDEKGVEKATDYLDGTLGDPEKIIEAFSSDAEFTIDHPGIKLLGWEETDKDIVEMERKMTKEFFETFSEDNRFYTLVKPYLK